jgi:2'-5' RNA ligase
VSLRAFFAVELPVSSRDAAGVALERIQEAVAEPARWTPAENLHVTLKFLGEIPADRVERLVAGAASKLARVEPFQVGLGGCGAFPNGRAARVLWIGVAQGAARLAGLARKLDAASARIGVERERKPFRAHLTCGRLRRPGPVALERVELPEIEPFTVDEVVLFESRLGSDRTRHVPLARIAFRAGQDDAHFAPDI